MYAVRQAEGDRTVRAAGGTARRRPAPTWVRLPQELCVSCDGGEMHTEVLQVCPTLRSSASPPDLTRLQTLEDGGYALARDGRIAGRTLHELIRRVEREATLRDASGLPLPLAMPIADLCWFHPSSVEGTFGCTVAEMATHGAHRSPPSRPARANPASAAWYAGSMGKAAVRTAITSGAPGTFLVRKSERVLGLYAVEISRGEGVSRIHIKKRSRKQGGGTAGYAYVVGGRPHWSLALAVNALRGVEIPAPAGPPLVLREPAPGGCIHMSVVSLTAPEALVSMRARPAATAGGVATLPRNMQLEAGAGGMATLPRGLQLAGGGGGGGPGRPNAEQRARLATTAGLATLPRNMRLEGGPPAATLPRGMRLGEMAAGARPTPEQRARLATGADVRVLTLADSGDANRPSAAQRQQLAAAAQGRVLTLADSGDANRPNAAQRAQLAAVAQSRDRAATQGAQGRKRPTAAERAAAAAAVVLGGRSPADEDC